MLVDKIIAQLRARLEGVTDPNHTQWLYLFNRAAAYDVGGAYALQQDYIQRGTYHAFMEEIRQHPDTRAAVKEMGPVVWAEGVPIFSYGCLLSAIDKHIASLINEDEWFNYVFDPDDMEWHHSPSGDTGTEDISPWVGLLIITAWLASNPKCKVLTLQSARPEKMNQRKTKIIRPARKQVRTVVIDGIERVYDPATRFMVYKVCHPPRRHEVTAHTRNLASGRSVLVKAHERGNISKGYVPWYGKGRPTTPNQSPRFRVLPDPSFFTAQSGK